MLLKNKQVIEIGVEGVVKATVMRPERKKDFRLREIVLEFEKFLPSMDADSRKKARKEMHDVLAQLRASCMVAEYAKNNLVLIEGLLQITKGLSDNLSSLDELSINYAAVGTGSTAPAASDSQLTTEHTRKVITSLNYVNGTLFAGNFLDYAEANTTLREGGLFIDGTATANSGYMFNHVLLESPTGITKTSADLLTINYQITFTAI